MSSLVVVAIPSQDNYVWKISSEKIPHLTLLFLGDHDVGAKRQRMVEFIEHAANVSLKRFCLMVDHRGKLGKDDADVLFFDRFNINMLENFRSSLLVNREIADEYRLATQYPEWTPHLTLGYPSTPAKPDTRDVPGIDYIFFDQIAMWDDNYDGPSFRLKTHNDSGVAYMTDTQKDVLTHHGVKGMKWGVKSNSPSGPSTSASNDSQRATAANKKARTSGTKSLSNMELQDLITRMNLEQQFSRLQPARFEHGQKFIKSSRTFGKTMNEVLIFLNSPAGKLIKSHVK